MIDYKNPTKIFSYKEFHIFSSISSKILSNTNIKYILRGVYLNEQYLKILIKTDLLKNPLKLFYLGTDFHFLLVFGTEKFGVLS